MKSGIPYNPERGGGGREKSVAGIDTEVLNRVLETVSGCLAINELYMMARCHNPSDGATVAITAQSPTPANRPAKA